MTVLSHLENTVSAVKLADWEIKAIDTSIGALSKKLDTYFNNQLKSKFQFGSYDRRTILKRTKDPNSDVDYMVVFKDGDKFTPQTLMTRLKTFAEDNYEKKEIYQSSPTIVLELSHIMFELAPAYIDFFGTYHIPAPASDYVKWISTYPNSMKAALEEKHKGNHYVIRDLILLLKYWNVKNNMVYTSYELEKYIVDKLYWVFKGGLKEYFYSAVEELPTDNLPEYKKVRVKNLKQVVVHTKNYENHNMLELAEAEIKMAI